MTIYSQRHVPVAVTWDDTRKYTVQKQKFSRFVVTVCRYVVACLSICHGTFTPLEVDWQETDMGLLDLHMYLSGAALTKCQHTLLCHSIWIDDSQNPKTCDFLILGMRTSLNNAYVQFRCTDIKLDVHSLRPVAKCGHTGNYVRMTLLCTLRWFKLHCIVLDHNRSIEQNMDI